MNRWTLPNALGSGHYLRQGGGGILKIARIQNVPPSTIANYVFAPSKLVHSNFGEHFRDGFWSLGDGTQMSVCHAQVLREPGRGRVPIESRSCPVRVPIESRPLSGGPSRSTGVRGVHTPKSPSSSILGVGTPWPWLTLRVPQIGVVTGHAGPGRDMCTQILPRSEAVHLNFALPLQLLALKFYVPPFSTAPLP